MPPRGWAKKYLHVPVVSDARKFNTGIQLSAIGELDVQYLCFTYQSQIVSEDA